MIRNQAGTIKVFAFNRTNNAPVIGDAANITCQYDLDRVGLLALADTTPDETELGFYVFNVTAAECNGTTVDFYPESTTSNVQVIVVEHNRYIDQPTPASTAVIGSTNAITRNINEELPIQFTWNSASATITGTVELGTATAVALQGAITFVRTDAAGKHWYQLAYDADDRPTVAGLARYVFTDGTDFLTVPVQFTEVASGGGGSIVVPIGGVVQTTVDGTTIKISTGTSAVTVTIATVDEDGTAVDCSALTLQVVIESLDKTDITTIANGSITKTSTTVAFAIPSSCRASEKTYRWSLRNTSNDLAIMGGSLFVTYAAGAD